MFKKTNVKMQHTEAVSADAPETTCCKYNNTLLSIIDTLYKKTQELNASLWFSEQNVIELKKQVQYKNEEIHILKETIHHRDDEIAELTHILNTSTDVDKYTKVYDEKESLERKLYNLKHEYDTCIKQFCDVEYTL